MPRSVGLGALTRSGWVGGREQRGLHHAACDVQVSDRSLGLPPTAQQRVHARYTEVSCGGACGEQRRKERHPADALLAHFSDAVRLRDMVCRLRAVLSTAEVELRLNHTVKPGEKPHT